MTFHKQQIWMVAAIGIILLYLSPLFILGQNSHIRIHDQMDSTVVWYKILADSGKLFASNQATIPNLMNGLPRVSLGSQFKLLVWLFVLFPPFVAFTINAIVVRFVAFAGMYFFLRKHILKENKETFIPVGVSLCFALLPFWLPGCLSIAGIPLASYAFLNIRNRNGRWIDWLIIALLPFAASFILTFLFFLWIMGFLWVKDWIVTKRSNWAMFSAAAMMTGIFLAKDYRLVQSVLLGQGFVPHRIEFNRGHSSLPDALQNFLGYFTGGQTHSYTLQYEVIIYAAGLFFLWFILKKIFQWTPAYVPIHENEKKLVFFILLAAAFALWYGIWYWEGLRFLKNAFHLAEEFNFGRIFFLNPIIWYLIFSLSLVLIATKWGKAGKPIAISLLCAQILVAFDHHHELKYRRYHDPTWQEFYSPQLFSQIKAYIGKDPSKYRVVSIGMHPAIAQYNGLYTLDFYLTLYPLEYKHQFRKIIAPELEKDRTLQIYFDRWGSRCYIFTHELGKHYEYTKTHQKAIHHLNLNTQALKDLGGNYILSAVKIDNAKEIHLKRLKTFENSVSVWRIYLYQVT